MSQDKDLDDLLESIQSLIDSAQPIPTLTVLLQPLLDLAYNKGYLQAHKDMHIDLPDQPQF